MLRRQRRFNLSSWWDGVRVRDSPPRRQRRRRALSSWVRDRPGSPAPPPSRPPKIRTHVPSRRRASPRRTARSPDPPPHRRILFFNLFTQIQSLAAICDRPFLCSPLPAAPLAAPPPAHRAPASARPFLSGLPAGPTSWLPSLPAPACELGGPGPGPGGGCATPGYRVQWPYLQPAGGGPAAIPAGLLAQCDLVRPSGGGGAGGNASGAGWGVGAGWAWDPFARRVRAEYLDCSRRCGAGGAGGAGCAVPFAEGGTPFHFAPAWYAAAAAAARDCLRGGGAGGAAAAAAAAARLAAPASGGPEAAASPAERAVGRCMAAAEEDEARLGGLAAECACGSLRWGSWPLATFHPADGPTRACDGGPYPGQVPRALLPAVLAACSPALLPHNPPRARLTGVRRRR
jgi:hypothetical protein